MSNNITTLRKPLTRRIGDLVIRIDGEAIAVRGHGNRTWRRVDWDRLLCLLEDDETPVITAAERAAGRSVRRQLTHRRPKPAMRIVDAGRAEAGVEIVRLNCDRCGHITDWTAAPTNRRARAWRLCPKCEKPGS